MKRDAISLAGLLLSPNVQAFLHMIRVGEGTADADGYRRHFGGRLFDSFDDHPRVAITAGLGRNQYTSTAAGAYQFLSRTWDGCRAALGLKNFSPKMQDIAAAYLIDGRKALDDVLAGRIEQAIAKCAREWASLPGSPYGQPTKTLEHALAAYTAAGGQFAPQEAPSAAPPTPRPAPETAASAPEPGTAWPFAAPSESPKESTMPLPAIIGALLPSFVAAIPQLGRLFGSGSEVAERNIKAAEIAVGIATQAVGARNAQEAAEVIAADPAMAQVAREAVEQRWSELVDAGGGGIAGARTADAAIAGGEGPWWGFLRSPSFWCLLILVPLVYLLVGSMIGLWGSVSWSDDVRAGQSGSIIGAIIGGAVGYYWGQTTSRNRTPG